MKKKQNELQKEIDIGLINIGKDKAWLAKKMGMTCNLFWAKAAGRANYAPFTEPELVKIRKALTK